MHGQISRDQNIGMLHAWLHHALKYQRQRGYSQSLSTVLPGQTQPEIGLVL